MNFPKKEKFYTEKQALIKIMAFCSYQERTQQEVRDKLYGFGLYKDVVEVLIVRLLEENYLNEERFAKAFAGGKFRIKQWGRIKIIEALKQKQLSSYCIKQAMKEISTGDYEQTLVSLIEKREEKETEENGYKRKHKTAQFIIGKGFEPELVWEIIKKVVP